MPVSKALADLGVEERDDENRQKVLNQKGARRVDRSTVRDGPLFVAVEKKKF